MRNYLLARRGQKECLNCGTLHTDVPVSYDEDGYFLELDTVACGDDECTKQLCSCCPQFTCEACGLAFCLEHVALEEEEECTCVQVDVDLFDNRNCERHNTKYPRVYRFCRVCVGPEVLEVPRIPIMAQAGTINVSREAV